MKKILSIVALTLLALFCLNSCDIEPVDVKAEIDSANAIFMEAVNTGDVDALKEIYLPDAILYPPNTEAITGADNIAAIMGGSAQAGVKMIFETVAAMAYGTTAIEEGKYKVVVPEDIVVDHGKYIVIWKKEGDVWKVSRDIFNTSVPLPPPPEAEEMLEEVTEE